MATTSVLPVLPTMNAPDLDMQDYNFQETLTRKGPEYEALLNEINHRFKVNKKVAGKYMRSHHRNLKLALLDAFKICFWCGIPVRDFIIPNGEQAPPDIATLDHVISRFTRQKGEWVLKVLSCYKCNQDRNVLEHRAIRKLSTRYPHMNRE